MIAGVLRRSNADDCKCAPFRKVWYSKEGRVVEERILMLSICFHLQPITEDDVERLCVCLRALADKSKVLGLVFGEQSREALVRMLSAMEEEGKKEKVAP